MYIVADTSIVRTLWTAVDTRTGGVFPGWCVVDSTYFRSLSLDKKNQNCDQLRLKHFDLNFFVNKVGNQKLVLANIMLHMLT